LQNEKYIYYFLTYTIISIKITYLLVRFGFGSLKLKIFISFAALVSPVWKTAFSLNLPIDQGFLQLFTKAFFAHSGTTAVTSISTLARSSTRSATCTSVMAG